MPSSFTDSLRLEKQADGENDSTWGDKLNTVLDLIEAAVAGRAAVTHDDTANYTLTTANSAADEARNMMLNIGGALTADRNVVCPTKSKLYVVKNATTGGHTITLKTSGGTGIAIASGKTKLLYCDGVNVVDGISALTAPDIGVATGTSLALTLGLTVAGGISVALSQKALTFYLLPSTEDGWRGIYRSGLDHWNRNQQYGGGAFGFEQVDAATGLMYKSEAVTHYIDTNSNSNVADAAERTWRSQGFIIPETQTIAAIWILVSKSGNPANNLGLFLLPDDGTGKPSGSTPITNGTATAQSGKLHTADANGQWYRFVFPTPPSCTGGTKYHIALKSSGAVDASNFWLWNVQTPTGKYPFGAQSQGDGTPTWTSNAPQTAIFRVELATGQILQSGGVFDSKLQFGGSGASGVLSLSRGLCNAPNMRLGELINPQDFSLWLVGTALTKSATFLDIGYGEDHDRIVGYIDSNGYVNVTVYDSTGATGTAHSFTVTGNADVSSGNHCIGISVKALGAGADYVKLTVDATAATPLTSQTIALDANFAVGNVGTMWVGGGFALAVTDTLKTTMANLPSNGGVWTSNVSGAGVTEANSMSVANNILYQESNLAVNTGASYYTKNPTFNHTNGWQCRAMLSVKSNTNTKDGRACELDIIDGTDRVTFDFQEYYLEQAQTVAVYPQFSCKAAPFTFNAQGKNTDYFAYANRRLVIDGSGGFTVAVASNQIAFGDVSTTASENANVQWKYVAYYNTAWNPPQFTSGSISDFAIWQGDMTALWPLLYNGGSPVSVKALLGLPNNYLDKSGKGSMSVLHGITSSPTTTSTAVPPTVVISELEGFVVGDFIEASVSGAFRNDTDQAHLYTAFAVDGVSADGDLSAGSASGGLGYIPGATSKTVRTNLGLHKVEGRFSVGSGTGSASGQRRELKVRVAL